MQQSWFTENPWSFHRLNTNPVRIGSLLMGSEFPVRIQSMANTPTHHVERSVEQAIQIIDAGGELVRFTVIDKKDAGALLLIKNKLVALGYQTPVVADVHFNPALADEVAVFVDKVRINPGNYLDKRASFTKVEFSDSEYKQELEKLNLRFVSFLTICKNHHTAVRIGTNHGSLSDRIMSRYGDTPAGMVEATMEFLRICQSEKFDDVVVSMKSSNTRVMVHAYRLLVQQMRREKMQYALHLGVTEAGDGEDGRIKSAVGIGALMNDGLGDTIRVSLTEHPAKELPVARFLVSYFNPFSEFPGINYSEPPIINPYQYQKRWSSEINHIGGKQAPVVVADLSSESEIPEETLLSLAFRFDEKTQTFLRGDLSPDVIYCGEQIFPFRMDSAVQIVVDSNYWEEDSGTLPLFSLEEYLSSTKKSSVCNWVLASFPELLPEFLSAINQDPTVILVVISYHPNQTLELRALLNKLIVSGNSAPFIIQKSYKEPDVESFQLMSAADTGLFFIDGLADGLWLKNAFIMSAKTKVDSAFSILQASRSRTTKTEYISCPSCGRTLFDLETTLAEVKKATQHLKGLKIAVMGCVVNGPGEMADADFGYVGAGSGKVSLYRGKDLIKRNIVAENAVVELLKLIEHSNYNDISNS